MVEVEEEVDVEVEVVVVDLLHLFLFLASLLSSASSLLLFRILSVAGTLTPSLSTELVILNECYKCRGC